MVNDEIFMAVSNAVLIRVVLRIGGTFAIAIFGRFVRSDPSPMNFARTSPAEIVEKKAKLVDKLFAVKKLVLRIVVLRTGGTAYETFVRRLPSPTN